MDELLVTHIRQNITSEQQLVLLSAVLPNSGDIAQWLFEDRGCLATDDSIVSTPKSIGFSSTQRDIHFFSDDKSNEDYYIPRILRVEQLKKLPRERSNKYFPDLSLSTDVAIYNAIKLCHNGGVAIYLGQQRSMKTVFERIINLDIGIAEVESLCNKRISYEMNFLIGNICDLIEVDGENEEQVDQRNILTLLQKKVKYGVPNMTAISICESVFNDRLLAIELAQILSDANIGTDKILNMLKAHSEEIFSCLDSYPEYFKDRLSVLMK